MNQRDRAVSPVISTILMVAIVVVLATTTSVFFLDVTEDINEPAPNVVDTTGEFVVDEPSAFDNQIVRITHIAGEGVAVEEIEIIIRASGPGVDTEARLVNLPSTSSSRLLDENIDGNSNLIDQGFGSARLIVDDGIDVWSAGTTIEFRINTGVDGADFRERESPDADELEVIIVHTPSEAIISKNIFTP